MPLLDRIQKDLVDAMKAKDELRLSAVRMIKTALLKYKADAMKEADNVKGRAAELLQISYKMFLAKLKEHRFE